MRKLLLVLALTIPLGGCSLTAGRVLDAITDVLDTIQVTVGLGKSAAMKYCAEVSGAVNQVDKLTGQLGASCRAKNAVHRLAAGVAEFCNNVDDINPADLRTVIASIKSARAAAREAIAAGC